MRKRSYEPDGLRTGRLTSGAEIVNEIGYLRSAFCYAMRSPIDAAVNLTGTSRTKVTRVYDYLRTACAFAEEAKGREAFFNDQEVEVDSARTIATNFAGSDRAPGSHAWVHGATQRSPSVRAAPQHNHAAWRAYCA